MSSPNEAVTVPRELGALIADREKVWADFERSQRLSAELDQLSSQVPQRTPAALQLQFGPDSTPPAELATMLPMLKEELTTTRKLSVDVQTCHDEIAAIRQREKRIIIGIVVGAVVLLLLLVLLLAGLLSSL